VLPQLKHAVAAYASGLLTPKLGQGLCGHSHFQVVSLCWSVETHPAA